MYNGIIDNLIAKGRSTFTLEDIETPTGSSPDAIRMALNRLQKKGKLAMPYRGFYLILNPQHRARGCLPPEQFIPDLMEYLGEEYYVGILSAAEYHGAAHQRPQVFQVVVPKSRRSIICGKVRVDFIFRKNAASIPIQLRNTPTGTVKMSTPEATALDLIGYVKHCGGLDNAATVLAELADKIDDTTLAEVAKHSPLSWAQRLGYLLELNGNKEKTVALAHYLSERHPVPTSLTPGNSIKGVCKDIHWQLYVNTVVEPDL